MGQMRRKRRVCPPAAGCLQTGPSERNFLFNDHARNRHGCRLSCVAPRFHVGHDLTFPGGHELGALQSADWIPTKRRGNQAKNYGKFGEHFQPLILIYRAVHSGMVSMGEVNKGEVTLVDLVEMNHYLDALDDIQYFANEDSIKMQSKCFQYLTRNQISSLSFNLLISSSI